MSYSGSSVAGSSPPYRNSHPYTAELHLPYEGGIGGSSDDISLGGVQEVRVNGNDLPRSGWQSEKALPSLPNASQGDSTSRLGHSQTNVEEFERVQPKDVTPHDGQSENTTHRALNANQATMITLGGTFGVGLLTGTGQGLYQGGPLGLLIAYSFVCFICYCMMTGLSEMATFLPHKKGFVGLVSLYVDPSVGFALGWAYLCQFYLIPALMINTAAIVMKYSAYTLDMNGNPVGNLNPVPAAAWRFTFIVVVVGINCLGIRTFGHVEFWLSTFKIFVIVTLIMYGLVVDLGGAPLKSGGFQRLGFLFWGSPYGPFGHAQGEDSLHLFSGFWSGMIHALFSLMGIEQVGVAVGEIANPRRSVPIAIKRTYRLVFTLYILGVIIVGLICSSNDPTFNSTDPDRSRGGLASPFIIAANRLAINGLVPAISAAIITFALSCATSNFYTGTRVIYGLALDGQAPAIFGRVTAAGRPLLPLLASTVFCFLSYMGQNETNPMTPFFSDMTTESTLDLKGGVLHTYPHRNAASVGGITWICIFWAHLRFRQVLRIKNYDLSLLEYASPVYPYGTWFGLVSTICITALKGWESWQLGRGGGGITAAYIIIPFFLILPIAWKLREGKEILSLESLDDVDLMRVDREIEDDEEKWKTYRSNPPPQPWFKRLFDS